MKRSIRFISIITLIVMLASLFTACGDNNKGGAEVSNTEDVSSKVQIAEIEFIECLSTPERTKFLEELLSDFKEKNTGINVELTTLTWEQSHQKVMTLAATNQMPDVLESNMRWTGELVGSNKLESLEAYYNEWEYKDTISKMALDIGTGYDDTLYMIPYNLMYRAMYYRKDWLEEANVEVPKNVKELYEASAKITDASKNRYGYAFRGGTGALTQMDNFILTQGGFSSYFAEDGKFIYRDPKAIQAFKDYCNLYFNCAPKDSINWGYAEKVDAFTTGTVGFLMQDAEVIGVCKEKMEEGTWDVAMHPVGPDGKHYTPVGACGFSMSSDSENKDAAWTLISYFLSPEINIKWGKTCNTMPVSKEALKDPYFGGDYIRAYTETMASENVVPVSSISYLPEIGEFQSRIVIDELQKYLLGEQTAEESMQNMADFIEKAQQNFESSGS